MIGIIAVKINQCWNETSCMHISKCGCSKFPVPERGTISRYCFFLMVTKKVGLRFLCLLLDSPSNQWPFQDPKLEVPTIYKAYFSGLCKRISPQNMAWKMVLTYLHQLDPGDLPLIEVWGRKKEIWSLALYLGCLGCLGCLGWLVKSPQVEWKAQNSSPTMWSNVPKLS